MKAILTIPVLALALATGGCAGMSDTQQRTMSGAAIGAGGGAIIGAIAGNAGMGAGIGAAAGAAGGYVYGKHKEAEANAYEEGRRQGAAEAR